MKKLFIILLAAIGLSACQERELVPEYQIDDVDIYASMETIYATKTSMDQYNNVLWSERDQLVAFMQTTLATRYEIKEQYVGSTSGGFSKVPDSDGGDDLETGQEIDHNVVLYPYSDQVMCMKYDQNTPAGSYKINMLLPHTQTYAENSFANGAFPMIAISSNNQLAFKNICGGIKLQFKGVDKIRSIKFEGIGGEPVSGKSSVVGYVDGTAPTIMMGSDASDSVTLDCGEGVQLSPDTPTVFIIAVPPVEFKSGMKITVTDTDGLSRTLTNTSANTIRRSSLLTFPVITYKQDDVFEFDDESMQSYEIESDGGTIEIPVVTNLDYNVVISNNATAWVKMVSTRALREETITLDIAENTKFETRSAEILFTSTDGRILQSVCLQQAPVKMPFDKIAKNQIWYKANNKITPCAAGIELSHEYDPQTKEGLITYSNPVTDIYSYAFGECASLISICLPEGLTCIEQYAFYQCSSLKTIYLPNSLEAMGRYAFGYCSALSNVTIPDNVTEIGDNAFCYCTSLTDVTLPIRLSEITDHMFLGCESLTNITIPGNVTSIRNGAFLGCRSLENMIIPEGITNIGSSAFMACFSLTSIVIPECVMEIASQTFANCSSLSSVVIPENVTEIGSSAFDNCSSLSSVVIPESVTEIGSSAFDNCSSLSSVVIPESVIKVGPDAFADCRKLKEVTVNGTPSFDDNAFRNSNLIERFNGPSAYGDGRYLIIDGKLVSAAKLGLNEIQIPDNVVEIFDYVYADCDNIVYLTLPENVKVVRDYAFANCSKLKEVTVGADAQYGINPFKGCDQLERFIYPNSYYYDENYLMMPGDKLVAAAPAGNLNYSIDYTEIGPYAYYGCRLGYYIKFDSGVKVIGDGAFEDTDIEIVYVNATTPPYAGYGIFPYGVTIYPPAECVDAYRRASGWDSYNISGK